jgi:glycosyltransferase involved in cell wall biosynthesis
MVSIVVPVYNTPADLLIRFLRSALGQTLDEIELIVIDDASRAECASMLDKTAAENDRMTVLHRRVNGRAGTARNDGLALAKGDYILFADADDFMQPDMCARLYELARENDADIVACGWSIRDQRGHLIGRGCLAERRYDLRSPRQRARAYRRLNYSLWNKLFRRSVITALRFEQYEANIGEDTLFNIAALCRSRTLVTTSYSGYDYYRHTLSATARASKGISYLETLAASGESVRRTLASSDCSSVGIAFADRVSLNRFSTGCGWIAEHIDPKERAAMWEYWRRYLGETLVPSLRSHRLLALWFKIVTSNADASSAYRLTWWALWATNLSSAIDRFRARHTSKRRYGGVPPHKPAAALTQ